MSGRIAWQCDGRWSEMTFPAGGPMERYAHLVAQGKIKLKAVTAAERHSMPHYEVPEDVDPVALLLAGREEDDR
ncbi:hypothetical protein ACFYQA_06635 [Streptomyces sp. NPDC005774]